MTRTIAISLLEASPDELDPREAELITSEEHWAMELADTKGMLCSEMLARMGSREYTRERARSIVNLAILRIQQSSQRH